MRCAELCCWGMGGWGGEGSSGMHEDECLLSAKLKAMWSYKLDAFAVTSVRSKVGPILGVRNSGNSGSGQK